MVKEGESLGEDHAIDLVQIATFAEWEPAMAALPHDFPVFVEGKLARQERNLLPGHHHVMHGQFFERCHPFDELCDARPNMAFAVPDRGEDLFHDHFGQWEFHADRAFEGSRGVSDAMAAGASGASGSDGPEAS